MTAFLPGDIVTRVGCDRLGRVVKVGSNGQLTVRYGDPYSSGGGYWVEFPASTFCHAPESDAVSHRAFERTCWQQNIVRRLLRRLENHGIDSMHARDVRQLLDIAGKYIDLPVLDYWRRD